jgi:hypothetical protein
MCCTSVSLADEHDLGYPGSVASSHTGAR